MIFEPTESFAKGLDEKDPLKKYRDHFIIPETAGKKQIYFLGNSLGLQPKATSLALKKILDQWAAYGVESFFTGEDPWMHYHDKLVQPLSTIMGAYPQEISVMNQLTVNLHLMMVSFYRPSGKRKKIICEAKAFPSDQYMFETHIKHYGFEPDEILIEVAPRAGEYLIRQEDIIAAIEQHKEELALVLWGGINYYTGQLFDIKSIASAAHKAGALAGFDLAHAAGNVPLKLHDWDIDFACWCSYKYLNAGPGGVGGVYIHERFHNDASISRFAGWWGYEKSTRFKMEKGFKPIPTAEGWQLSTPPLLLYASHLAALDITQLAGWENIQTKRKLLNNYLWYILGELNNRTAKKMIECITPQNEAERGSQVSILMLQDGKKVFDGLMNEGIITDWREPNVIRLAPVPLYNTFEEVWVFGNLLGKLVNAY